MVFSSGHDLYPDPPAYRLGIDVMLLQLPKRDTFTGFVGIFSEQVLYFLGTTAESCLTHLAAY